MAGINPPHPPRGGATGRPGVSSRFTPGRLPTTDGAITTLFASVSFARTPLKEISYKVEQLAELGWREDEELRGDPWIATFVKDLPEEEADEAVAELRRVMGDDWIEANEIRELSL